MEGEHPQTKPATRGLATVALLKVNFDAGRDHISMFEPFVLDTIAQINSDGFTSDQVRVATMDRHQLTLPVSAVATVLGRIVKRGFLKREGGRYFFTGKESVQPDLQIEREKVEERQRRL